MLSKEGKICLKICLWCSSVFCTVLCEGFLAFLKLQFNQLLLKVSSFIYTFCVTQNLMLYLHCSSNKLVEKTNHENLNIIKNTLSIKLGNPKSMKEYLKLMCTKVATICWERSKRCFVHKWSAKKTLCSNDITRNLRDIFRRK